MIEKSKLKWGEYLKAYRKKHFLTQIQMAKKLQMDRSYYTMVENGHFTPGIKTQRKIVDLLNEKERK